MEACWAHIRYSSFGRAAGQLSYLPAHVCNSESVIKFNNNNTCNVNAGDWTKDFELINSKSLIGQSIVEGIRHIQFNSIALFQTQQYSMHTSST